MYSFTVDVPAPIEAYDALHQAIRAATGGGQYPGLLVHIAHATATGFQILEVWQDRESYERFDVEIAVPIMTQFGGGHAPEAPQPDAFELRGFVVSGEAMVV